MISDIVEGIVEFIIRIFVEILCFYTGEILIYVISFGYKKVRWDYYSDASVTKWMLLTDLSALIGAAFWIFSIGSVARLIG